MLSALSRDRVNKWLKKTPDLDDKVVEMSNEATTYHDQITKLVNAIQKQAKDCGSEKHPFGKAANGIRNYKDGMVTKSLAGKYDKMAEAMDKLMEANAEFGRKISSGCLSKCLSFRDVDCRDVDQQMKQLAKVCKDLESNRKKAEKDQNKNYLVDASLESLKKLTEDSLITLEKFNKASVVLLNATSSEYKKQLEAYNAEAAKIINF
ncbi:unnamed protein product [Caenorhabditis angaria]|uniref:BAR domain-containing protein n=1 Tax=Caenorhabditis angaria TaxID=860376 RepID=A0A9P1N680_9PELO|nr:unnamed protein product [Caenorhabditis angaria]